MLHCVPESTTTLWSDDLVVQFLRPCFGTRLADPAQCHHLLRLRRVSHQFLRIVDQELAPAIEQLGESVLSRVCPHVCRLLCFTGLVELNLFALDASCLLRLSRLSRLVIGSYHPSINDTLLTSLTTLRHLELGPTRAITDASLARLTALTSLDLSQNLYITNGALTCLTRLERLFLCGNGQITDSGLTPLTRLVTLDLARNQSITNAALLHLTGLTGLALDQNKHITDTSVRHLTALTGLSLCDTTRVTTDALSRLPSLVRLELSGHCALTTAELCQMTRLDTLVLLHNDSISGAALRALTRLTYLRIEGYHFNVHLSDLAHLTRLRTLQLPHFSLPITDSFLLARPHLRALVVDRVQSITPEADRLLTAQDNLIELTYSC